MGQKKTCCKRYKHKGKACKNCPLQRYQAAPALVSGIGTLAELICKVLCPKAEFFAPSWS